MVLTRDDFQETYSLLQSLVQAGCVNPPGNELKAIKVVEAFLKNKGITEIFISESAQNRANLFSKISGSDPHAGALLLGPAHVDVVPVSNLDQWIDDPFSGTIKDGFMYGRGTLDMLYIVASQVIAFCKVFEERIFLKGDLMLLIVADEESGGTYGTDHFFKHHKDLLQLDQHKVYAITEGGGSVLYNNLLLLRAGERGSFWKRLSFSGTPGHGAFPFKTDNAITKASAAATRLYEYMHNDMPTDIEPVRLFLESLATFDTDIAHLLSNESNFKSQLSEFFNKNPKLARDLFSITHLTFSPNVIEGGNKVNSVPGMAYLDVDIRTLPQQDEAYVMKHLTKALGSDLKPEISSMVDEDAIKLGSLSPPTPDKSTFVKAIHEVVAMDLPNVKIIPSIVGGGTDARYCRAIDIDAYGFSVLNPELDPSELGPIHGINERIDLKSIDLTLSAYYNLVLKFLN